MELIAQLSIETPADRPGVVTLLYSGKSGPNDPAPRRPALQSTLLAIMPVTSACSIARKLPNFCGTEEFLEAAQDVFGNR